jgi:methionyl aminopeptidase
LIKSKTEIQGLREAGRIVAQTFEIIREEIHPGVELRQLDKIAEKFIIKEGAETLYRDYSTTSPGAISWSNHGCVK